MICRWAIGAANEVQAQRSFSSAWAEVGVQPGGDAKVCVGICAVAHSDGLSSTRKKLSDSIRAAGCSDCSDSLAAGGEPPSGEP